MSRGLRNFSMDAASALSARAVLHLDLEDILAEAASQLDQGDLLDLIKTIMEGVDEMSFSESVKQAAQTLYDTQELADMEDDDDVP
jgi:hypothetical protein